MIRYYVQVILNGTIKKSIQPLLYMIAIHHLNGFLFDQTRTEQLKLQRTIVKNLQMALRNDKVYFKIYLLREKKKFFF
jgi:hypothetical protein